MLRLLIIGFILSILTAFTSDKDFDEQNKSLRKELQKIGGVEKVEWKDLEVPEKLKTSHSVQGKFMILATTSANDQIKYLYVGRVNSCRSGGCSNPNFPADIETSEYFDYLIVFNAELAVEQVKVYNYQATHGQEVTNKGWLRQFKGYNGSRQLTVGKSIDAISGATVSVYSITDDIQDKTLMLKEIIRGSSI
jgi:hypothetical protein